MLTDNTSRSKNTHQRINDLLEDPVRVFQDFATVDQLSGGRAEILVGRGSFIESYPLFGHSLQDYDEPHRAGTRLFAIKPTAILIFTFG